MANWKEYTDSEKESYVKWLASRPPAIQDMIIAYPPNRLYRLGAHRVTIHSYNENGTVTVRISGEYNCLIFARDVPGVDPATLVESELPLPSEKLGVALTDPKEIEAYVRNLKAD